MSSDSRSSCSSSSLSRNFSSALSESSVTSTNTSHSWHPTLPPKEFIPNTSASTPKQDLLLSMKMESIEFSQKYYLLKASDAGSIRPFSSDKTLNPQCREFKPKSFMYSGIDSMSTPPPPSPPSHRSRSSRSSRRNQKDQVRMGTKSVKKEHGGGKAEEREWEWMEAELEEVGDVWAEEDEGSGQLVPGFGKGAGDVQPGRGGSGDGGGRTTGMGGSGGVDDNGGLGNGVGVAGKINVPNCKRWMIVTQKMVDEYSF